MQVQLQSVSASASVTWQRCMHRVQVQVQLRSTSASAIAKCKCECECKCHNAKVHAQSASAVAECKCSAGAILPICYSAPRVLLCVTLCVMCHVAIRILEDLSGPNQALKPPSFLGFLDPNPLQFFTIHYNPSHFFAVLSLGRKDQCV